MIETCDISILQVWPSRLMNARKVQLLHSVYLSCSYIEQLKIVGMVKNSCSVKIMDDNYFFAV